MTALSSPQWPLDQLVAALRDLHSIPANEGADRLETFYAQLILETAKSTAWAAEREDIAAHLRYLATELRNAGCDVGLVVMDDDGVAPSALTFADSLELVAIQLAGILR